jgi:hypothetical protein
MRILFSNTTFTTLDLDITEMTKKDWIGKNIRDPLPYQHGDMNGL